MISNNNNVKTQFLEHLNNDDNIKKMKTSLISEKTVNITPHSLRYIIFDDKSKNVYDNLFYTRDDINNVDLRYYGPITKDHDPFSNTRGKNNISIVFFTKLINYIYHFQTNIPQDVDVTIKDYILLLFFPDIFKLLFKELSNYDNTRDLITFISNKIKDIFFAGGDRLEIENTDITDGNEYSINGEKCIYVFDDGKNQPPVSGKKINIFRPFSLFNFDDSVKALYENDEYIKKFYESGQRLVNNENRRDLRTAAARPVDINIGNIVKTNPRVTAENNRVSKLNKEAAQAAQAAREAQAAQAAPKEGVKAAQAAPKEGVKAAQAAPKNGVKEAKPVNRNTGRKNP